MANTTRANPHLTKNALRLAAIVLIAAHRSAIAQVTPSERPLPVDQGAADVDPLRTSLRLPLDRDLRSPVGWNAVYPVRYRDASGRDREGFARANGGLVAVFPWSVYAGGSAGVPPGTVFRHGTLSEVASASEDAPEHSEVSRPVSRPDAAPTPTPVVSRPSLDARPWLTTPPQPPPLPAATVPSLWTDDAYRRRRMSGLLTRAAAAEIEASGPQLGAVE